MISPVLVVIPYLASAAQGRELEYAISGWTRHFKCPHKIVIVGEGLHAVPEWIRSHEDVSLVESPRVKAIPGQYRQHLDYVSCLRKVRERFPQGEGFIMVADDCYAVNDFDLADVMFFKMLEPEFVCDPETPNQWRQDKLKTKRALQEDGAPVRNFTTHLPQWYEWNNWEAIVTKYGMDKESYVIEDLYYNTYYAGRIPFRLDKERDNLKYGVYTPHPPVEELRMAFTNKIWITNSPDGWQPALEHLLMDHFGL